MSKTRRLAHPGKIFWSIPLSLDGNLQTILRTAKIAALLLLIGDTSRGDTLHGDAEVQQTKATLFYQMQDYKNAMAAVKSILAADSGNIPALELLALCLQRQKDETGAATTYRRLIEIGKEPLKHSYRFELATILFHQKKHAEARPLFADSAQGGFNPGVSRFFMGLIDFENKQWSVGFAAITKPPRKTRRLPETRARRAPPGQ
ncbi:MAG: tetratricopeptide repeat protein [Deltaproteobacteria bacterium]|nr:tetratricopeptide repeat protein [Deltaproteobacteria bacterium]